MTNELIQITEPSALAVAGQAANQAAAAGVFSDYRSRKAANTLRRQEAGLSLFASFLRSTGVEIGDLARDPESWEGVTWGLLAAWQQWQLRQGYAVPSVNVRLSTAKTYAKLALKAGTLDPTEYALIRAVEGYSHKEAKRVNEKREAAEIPLRLGSKKAESVSISQGQAQELKDQPDTPRGRRDGLLMCLLLDHGLRVGEVASLQVSDIDLKTGEMRFYRPKVDMVQTHKLSEDTKITAKAYMASDAPALGCLWRSSSKGKDGKLNGQGMTTRALTERVRVLGEEIDVHCLSAHDCRHYWATNAARNGTPIDRLQDAGGWSSPAMPLRYVDAAKIANEGVVLK